MSIYQIVVKANAAGFAGLRNIHHYEFPGYVPTSDELEEAAQGLADAYETHLFDAFSNQVTFNAMDLRRVDVGDQPTQEFVPTDWPDTGNASGSMLPPQVSALATWKAPTAFPRSTRTYLFPMTVSVLTALGFMTSGLLTSLDNFGLALEELSVTGQVDAQKVAVKYSGDPRVVTDSNIVFQTPAGNIWATQRSRRYGVGI